MSKKNSLLSKRQRRVDRINSNLQFKRAEPGIPLEVSSGVLCDCKTKHNRAFKQAMFESRGREVVIPREPAKPLWKCLEQKMRGKNAVGLSRVYRKSIARARRLQAEAARAIIPSHKQFFAEHAALATQTAGVVRLEYNVRLNLLRGSAHENHN